MLDIIQLILSFFKVILNCAFWVIKAIWTFAKFVIDVIEGIIYYICTTIWNAISGSFDFIIDLLNSDLSGVSMAVVIILVILVGLLPCVRIVVAWFEKK